MTYASSVSFVETVIHSQTLPLSIPALFRENQFYQPNLKRFFSLVSIIGNGKIWETEVCTHLEKLTPWQTTQRGNPNGSSHSPWLKGNVTLLSLPEPETPESYADVPLLRCCHSFMTSSIFSVDSSSSVDTTLWRSTTQSRVCRTQFQGSDQSSRNTIRLSGIDFGVKRGFSSGANAGEGSQRK